MLTNKVTGISITLKFPVIDRDFIVKNILVSLGYSELLENLIHYDSSDNTYFTILDTIEPHDMLLNIHSYTDKYYKDFNNVFLRYKKQFPDITKDDLVFISSVILHKITGVDIDTYLLDEMKTRQKYHHDIKKQLEKYSLKYHDSNSVFPVDNHGKINYYMNLANINIDASNLSKPFDLYKIIKEMSLSKDIPFMAIIKENANTPIVKVHKSISKETLADWVLINQKPKVFKGLNFKIVNKIGEYRNINCSRLLPRFFIKFSYSDDHRLNLNDVKSEANYIVSKLVNNISPIFGKKIYLSEPNLVSFSIKTKLKYYVDILKIKEHLYKYMSNKNKDTRGKNSVKINETSGNSNTSIRFEYSTFLYILQENILSIFSLKKEEDIILSIRRIQELIPFSSMKTNKEKIIEKVKKNINIDSVDCQKIRRPDITIRSNDVNSILYKGEYYTCKNNKNGYPFIGYTVKGNPCCFKRPKEFIDGKDFNIRINLQTAFKNRILTTDKILPEGKLGKISSLNNLYRVYNTSGLIKYCILWLLDSSKNLNNNVITDELFRTIDNGSVFDKYNIVEYRKMFQNNNIQQSEMIDIFEKIFKINIIVYEIEVKRGKKDIIKTINGLNSHYPKTIMLYKMVLKDKIHYEPIIYTNNKGIDISKYKMNIPKPLYTPPYKMDLSEIKFQIVSSFNKTEYIVTNKGVFPVYPFPPIYGIKMLFQEIKPFITLKDQIKICKDMNINIYYQIIGDGDESNQTVGLLAGCNKINGIIPVIPSSIDKDIPLSPMIYRGLLISNYLINTYEIKEINDIIYYKELFTRFKMLVDFIIPKETIAGILKSKIQYNIKWRTLKGYLLKTKEFISFITDVRLEDYYIPSHRDICSKVETVDPFCDGNKLIMTLDTYDIFIDKLVTIILNNNLDLTAPKNLERFQGFTLRDNEIILTTDKDFKNLLKIKK